MKKLLLIALLGVALVVFGANSFYAWQIEKKLDEVSAALAVNGINIEHAGVEVNYSGELSLNHLVLRLPALGAELRAERVIVPGDDWLSIHSLAADIRSHHLPESLDIVLSGMSISRISKENAFDAFNELSVQACGERTRFTYPDLVAMGYPNPRKDMRLQMEFIGQTHALRFLISEYSDFVREFELRTDITLNAVSRDFDDIRAALDKAQVQGVRFHYRDLGFNERMLSYCEDESGYGRDTLIQQHIVGVRDILAQKHGLSFGDNGADAYQRLLRGEKELNLMLRPNSSLSYKQLIGLDPKLLLGQLSGDLTVGGNNVGVFDIASLAERRAENPSSSNRTPIKFPPRAEKEQEPAPIQTRRIVVTLENVGEFLGAELSLKLGNSRELSGILEEVGKETLHLKISSSGGYLVRPVMREDVQAIELIKAAQP
jgi:hypothetical protein